MAGRKQKYSNEELENGFYECASKHKDQKIGYKMLEDETGIPVHIWKDRMKNLVDDYNKKVEEINIKHNAQSIIPSAGDVMTKLYNNPTKLEYYIGLLSDRIALQEEYKDIEKYIKRIKEKYEDALDEKTKKCIRLEKELAELNNMLNVVMLESQNNVGKNGTNILECTLENEMAFKNIVEKITNNNINEIEVEEEKSEHQKEAEKLIDELLEKDKSQPKKEDDIDFFEQIKDFDL